MVELTCVTYSNLLSHLESLRVSLKEMHQTCMCNKNSIAIQNTIIDIETMIRFMEIISIDSAPILGIEQEPSVHKDVTECDQASTPEQEYVESPQKTTCFCLQSKDDTSLPVSLYNDTPPKMDVFNDDKVCRMLEKSLVEHDKLHISIDQVEGKLSELFHSVSVKENRCENECQPGSAANVEMKLCSVGEDVENLLQEVEQKKAMIKIRQNNLQEKLSDLRKSLEAPM